MCTVQCTSMHNYFATYCVVGMELYIKVSFVLKIHGKKIPLWAQTSRSRRIWSSTIQKYNTATHLQRNISVSPFGEDHILQQKLAAVHQKLLNITVSKTSFKMINFVCKSAKVHSGCVWLLLVLSNPWEMIFSDPTKPWPHIPPAKYSVRQ